MRSGTATGLARRYGVGWHLRKRALGSGAETSLAMARTGTSLNSRDAAQADLQRRGFTSHGKWWPPTAQLRSSPLVAIVTAALPQPEQRLDNFSALRRLLVATTGTPRPSVTRWMAAFARPQDLHRHRKRLDGFGKDASKGDSKTLAACGDLLKDDDWYARKVAVDTIARVAKHGDEAQLSLLYKHMEDEDIFVREAAVDAVAAIAPPTDDVCVSKVAMRLADEDCFVRARAVVAIGILGRPGDAETIGLLDEMFEDGFVPVRKKVIEAVLKLAEPNNKVVLERLRRCLEDSDRGVRTEAKEALATYESRA